MSNSRGEKVYGRVYKICLRVRKHFVLLSRRMSRTNNVRGPTSALTEFLRVGGNFAFGQSRILVSSVFQESGITPTTVARRVATRDQQPIAGPSGTQANGEEEADQWEDDGEASRASPRRRTRAVSVFQSLLNYDSLLCFRQQDTRRTN